MSKNPLVSAGCMGLIPGPGRFHMSRFHMSFHMSTKPTCHNNQASALEPVPRNKRSHTVRSPCTARKGGSRLPQLEKACGQQ